MVFEYRILIMSGQTGITVVHRAIGAIEPETIMENIPRCVFFFFCFQIQKF